MIDYAVVISSTGRKDYLLELLCSIERQSIPPSEIMLILDDNLSSRSLGQQLQEMFSKLNVYYPASCNLPAKRNMAASICTSDLILFSDDDDIWFPNKATRVLEAFTLGAKAVCHNYNTFGTQNSVNCSPLGKKDRFLSYISLLAHSNIFGGGSAICAHKSLLQTIEFNEKLPSSEDYDWWIRVLSSSIPTFYISESLVSYRRHHTNMTQNLYLMYTTISLLNLRKCAIGLIFIHSGIHGLLRSSLSTYFRLVSRKLKSLFLSKNMAIGSCFHTSKNS
jgi:glycosyltransferase involved in cell wall biosynthesis